MGRASSFESGSFNDAVEGNLIGLDQDGLTARANNQSGVFVSNGSIGITIGGTTPGSGNTISGNTIGITITNTGTTGNLVEGNTIGLAADGSTEVRQPLFRRAPVQWHDRRHGRRHHQRRPERDLGQRRRGSGSPAPGRIRTSSRGTTSAPTPPAIWLGANLQLGITLGTASNNTIGGDHRRLG